MHEKGFKFHAQTQTGEYSCYLSKGFNKTTEKKTLTNDHFLPKINNK